MTHTEFENFLDRYGSNIDDWPEIYQSQASVLVQETPHLRSLLLRQATIENQIQLMNKKAPSSLRRKIVNQIKTTEPMDVFINWLSFSLVRTTIALIVPVFIGMGLGSVVGSGEHLQSEMDTISYTQYLLESEYEI